MIKEAGLEFDIAFTSVLKRAIKTLFYIQDGLDLHWIPVRRHWRLNERMYGALQGLNKSETAQKHGEEQVKVRQDWRPKVPRGLLGIFVCKEAIFSMWMLSFPDLEAFLRNSPSTRRSVWWEMAGQRPEISGKIELRFVHQWFTKHLRPSLHVVPFSARVEKNSATEVVFCRILFIEWDSSLKRQSLSPVLPVPADVKMMGRSRRWVWTGRKRELSPCASVLVLL